MIQKQTIAFRFGSADTDTGDKHIKTGDLVSAIDVRMTNKRGRYSKRPGFDVAQTTFNGGSFVAPATDIIGAPGGGTLIRDSGNSLWSEFAGTATYIGSNPRPWPTSKTLVNNSLTICRPRSCEVGSNTWFFTCNNAANSYLLSIVNTATGATILAQTTVGATGNPKNLAPVYDGTNVWLFYVTGATTVLVHKFVVATPSTAPTGYTYTTTANASYCTLDARWMPGANGGAGRTYAVYAGGASPGTITRTRGYSYLNTATGAATSESITSGAGSAGQQSPSVYILENQDGSAASWYFVYGGQQIAAATQSVFLYTVSSSAWTNTGSSVTTSWPNGPNIGSTSTTTYYYHSIVTGYCQDATTQVVFCQSWSTSSSASEYWRNDTLSIFKATFNAGTWNNDCTRIATGSWIASGPWTFGGAWYFLTGFDDGMVPMVSGRHLQQSYHVRNSSGVISAQILPGEGAGMNHIEASPSANVISYMCVPRPVVTGNVVSIAITTSDSNIAFCAGSILKIDYAKKYGRAVPLLGRAIVPGPVPQIWSSYGTHEIAPMLFPSWVTAAVGGVTVATAVAIRYVIVDPDGTQWRGAPTILVQNMAAAASIVYPTLRHELPGTTVMVEIYLANTLSTTPYLQTTVANDPTVDQQTYAVPAAVVVGESLDTFGGALAQTWPLQCQAVTVWRNRVVLAHQNHLHYSQEMQDGLGPVFNEALTAIWSEAAGDDVIALCAVNYDYLGAWCSRQVAVISGPGPDGAGRGNYTVMPIATLTGTDAPNSVVQGPDGAYYYDGAAGRLCVLTPSLSVKDAEGISRGFFAAGEDVYGNWWEEQRCMLWTSYNRTQLVLDYGNRSESCPLGRMYQWTVTGYNYAYYPWASIVAGGRVKAIDAYGDIYTSQAAAANYSKDVIRGADRQILKYIQTAWLQPLDLQVEFSLRTVHAIMTRIAESSVLIRVFVDYSTTPVEAVTATTTATNQQFSVNPSGSGRIQAVQIVIADTAYATPTNGADFDGVALTIQPRGRAKMLSSSQVL